MELYNKHEHHKLCFLNCFASILVLSIFMVRRLFWIAFARPSKLYRIGPLFTHKDGCGGAISVTEGGLRRADLKSGASHIGCFLCLTLEQDLCRPGPLLQLWIPFRGASKKCLGTPSSLVPRRFLGSSRLIAAREHV